MYINFIIGLSVLIAFLVILAEGTKKPELGVMAAVLLFILGGWIFLDGIQYQTGEITTTTISGATPSESSPSGNTTLTNATISEMETATTTDTYAPLPTTPLISLPDFLALLCVLLGMYAGLHYVVQISKY